MQPRLNVWVYLPNVTKQETMYVSVVSPSNPFSTCLVGLLMDVWPIPEDSIHTLQIQGHSSKTGKFNPIDDWDHWTRKLPHAPIEPQELEPFGSVKMDYCIKFYHMSTLKDISPNNKLHKNQTLYIIPPILLSGPKHYQSNCHQE